MNKMLNPNVGATVMRLALGTLLLVHSLYLKVVIFTVAGTVSYFEGLGLPGFTAYLVIAGEAIAGSALIAGFHTRLFALAMIPVLAGATWAHGSYGWLFTNAGGGWEFPLFLTVSAVAQVFLGDGVFAAGSRAIKLPAVNRKTQATLA